MGTPVIHAMASRPGDSRRLNQDRIRATANSVVLLDGASAVRPQRLDGGWYAERLAAELAEKLAADPAAELRAITREGIAQVARDIEEGDGSPSSTVVILRWCDDVADLLVLGDSVAVVYRQNGTVDLLRDTRLESVGVDLRQPYERALRDGQGFTTAHRQRLKSLQAEQLRMRNRPDGFWIAANDPHAANEAQTYHLPSANIEAVLLASDGFADGVLTYGIFDWREARQMILTDGAPAALSAVHEAEAKDHDGRRWPRSKVHDDKSLVLVEFEAV